MIKYTLIPIDVIDNEHCSSQCMFLSKTSHCILFDVDIKRDLTNIMFLRDEHCVINEFPILLTERLLTIAVEAGTIGRGLYAEAMNINRCDIDEKIEAVKKRDEKC